MSDHARLLDLVEYLENVAKLSERAPEQIKDYGGLRYHEASLSGRVGVHLDLPDDGDGPVWLRIDRLRRTDPPLPEAPLADWIAVSNDPTRAPEVRSELLRTLPREEAKALVAAGKAREEDVAEPMRRDADANARDVQLRLADDPDLRAEIDSWIDGTWRPWAETEAPVRETIRIYDAFFSLQQAIETDGAEKPREVVWGVGVARWRAQSATFDLPLVEQLVEIEVAEDDGALNVRPRAAQPAFNAKPFEKHEIAGVDVVVEGARKHFKGLAERDEDFSPFRAGAFEPILKQAANHLDRQGAYLPESDAAAGDRTLPEMGDTLKVTDTWVIYDRPRSENFILNDLNNLRTEIEKTTEQGEDALPRAARRLVSHPPSGRVGDKIDLSAPLAGGPAPSAGPTDPGGTAGAAAEPAPEGDYYFPKPFNDDQIEIVKRLDREDGVVVQGPPGTGKTHTIANIVCHYMATGKRVLVVSKGESALSVLRGQIPEQVRDLSISLLTSEREGLKQLERAVSILAEDTVELDPGDLRRRISEGGRTVVRLRGRLQEIDNELRRWAETNLKEIDLGDGATMLPMDLARRLVKERDRHGWFVDRPDPGQAGAPPIDDAETARLRDARRRLGADLRELGCDLPRAADLPDSATLASVHDDLAAAERLNRQAREERVPALATTVDDAVARAERLDEDLRLLIAGHDAAGAASWLAGVLARWGARDADDMERLFDELVAELRAVAEARAEFLRVEVEMPEAALDLAEVDEALARIEQGKRAFPMISFGKSEARTAVANARVDGRAVETSDDARTARRWLEWRRRLRVLCRKWKKLGHEFSLPLLGDGEEAARTAQSIADTLDAVDAGASAWRDRIASELPLLFPHGLDARAVLEDADAARRAREVVRLNVSRCRLSASRARRQDLLDRLQRRAGTPAREMKAFVEETLGDPEVEAGRVQDAWDGHLAECRRLRELEPDFETVAEIAGRIEAAGAPSWAARLKSEPAGAGGDPLVPEDWRESWRWAQLDALLRRIDGRARLRALGRERQQVEDELRAAFVELVRLRTYAGLHNNLDGPVRSALNKFTSAIKKIGKGTGQSARRYRRYAREAMQDCYSAVPCWIMPEWRVSESLPAKLGSFDLVIFDEASQSDMQALPALMRAKKILCVGDDKQVSPSAVGLHERTVKQLEHNFLKQQVHRAQLLPGASLYDLMSVAFPGERIMLREHFRCVEPIIRFSMRFYNKPMLPMRVPKPSERMDPPLIDLLVPHGSRSGGKNSKINRAEAEVVVDEIARLVDDESFGARKIGVISLIGYQQAQLIQRLLLERIGEQAFQRHRIACGDAATFQGNEADVVFLSMVADPQTARAVTGETYKQRFNVALSRARDRMVLVRSVPDALLTNPNDLKYQAVQHFRDPMQGAEPAEDDLSERCQSNFEREVYQRLRADGYRTIPQVPAAGYSIDLVVEGDNDARLAVELDGDRYHGPETWWNDFQRQQALERVGWRFWRCWGSSWTLDPEGCYADLRAALDELGIGPAAEDARPGVRASARRIALRDGGTRPATDAEMTHGVPEGDAGPSDDAETAQDAASDDAYAPVGDRAATGAQAQLDFAPARRPDASNAGAGDDSAADRDFFDVADEEVVEVGDGVVLVYEDEPGRQVALRIDDSRDDPDNGVVHRSKPISQALIGSATDDEVEIEAGGRRRRATILKVDKVPPKAA